MPIRFRCVYCNKLLSIATRKAGTVIHCPTCEKPLIVPIPESEEGRESVSSSETETGSAGPARSGGASKTGRIFERDDFDKILTQGLEKIQTKTRPAPSSPPSSSGPSPDVLSRPGTEIPLPQPVAPPKTWLPPEPSPSPTQIVSDVELVPISGLQGVPPKGVVLTPIKMILLFLFLIGVMCLIFVIGFYVGRATVPQPLGLTNTPEKSSHTP